MGYKISVQGWEVESSWEGYKVERRAHRGERRALLTNSCWAKNLFGAGQWNQDWRALGWCLLSCHHPHTYHPCVSLSLYWLPVMKSIPPGLGHGPVATDSVAHRKPSPLLFKENGLELVFYLSLISIRLPWAPGPIEPGAVDFLTIKTCLWPDRWFALV